MQSNNQNLEMLEFQVDPKIEKLQTLLRKTISEMEKPEQRYLAHAILQSILFSMEQYCDITLQVTENCINDGPTDKPIDVKSLIQCMQAKNANPFSTMSIQPETLYFMRCNGYNDLIQDNKYSQDKYPNFNTYETIYTNALEGIAQGNLDIFSSLPQEIQNVVGECKDVLLKRIAEKNAYISLLIRIDESTTSEELTVIFEEVMLLHDDNLFAAIINKSNDPKLLARMAVGATKAIHNVIFDKAKNFSSDSDKSTVFKALIEESYDDLNLFIKIINNTNDKDIHNHIIKEIKFYKDDAYKVKMFTGFIKNCDLTAEMKNDILRETKAFENNCHKFVVCIQFMYKDASNFTEVIQIVATDHQKKAVLSEMLFATYNANINNKEGFKDRLQTYLPKVDADETFRIIQLIASSRLIGEDVIFIGYDKPLEAFHRRILYDHVVDSMLDKIQNPQNNSNTFANMIQNQNGVGGQGMNM